MAVSINNPLSISTIFKERGEEIPDGIVVIFNGKTGTQLTEEGKNN